MTLRSIADVRAFWEGFGADDIEAPARSETFEEFLAAEAPHLVSEAPKGTLEAAKANLTAALGTLIEEHGDRETVANGFGGETTRRKEAPADAPTPKQTAFVRSLLAERKGNEDAEKIRGALNEWRTTGKLTKKVMSYSIDSLLKIPKKEAQTLPAVVEAEGPPAGRYAIENAEGELRFYQVDKPTEGRWVGRTFVKVQTGDDLYPVRGLALAAVLAEITKDPEGASRRYGREIGRCGVCGRTLTDEVSRSEGIGPRCKEKGW